MLLFVIPERGHSSLSKAHTRLFAFTFAHSGRDIYIIYIYISVIDVITDRHEILSIDGTAFSHVFSNVLIDSAIIIVSSYAI